MAPYIIALLTALLVVLFVLEWRHQRRLSTRVRLMREALRNRDFMFRLPTDSIMPGERELQKMLNDMGGEINQLMARSEVESWQRLTRVLTHEIMNAVTPIQSITQAYIGSNMVKGTPLEEGIQAIYDTSRSLSAFVESYRKMTQLQTVSFEEIDLQRLVSNLQALYPTLAWHIDLNGVPFFTTKRTGSGIGLSLSRQMMMAQGGNLALAERAQAGYHTTFVVTL